jgi:hypothetical protein
MGGGEQARGSRRATSMSAISISWLPVSMTRSTGRGLSPGPARATRASPSSRQSATTTLNHHGQIAE